MSKKKQYHKWVPENSLSEFMYPTYLFRHQKGDNWYRLVPSGTGGDQDHPYLLSNPSSFEIAWNMVLKQEDLNGYQVWSDIYVRENTVYCITRYRTIEFLVVPENYEI